MLTDLDLKPIDTISVLIWEAFYDDRFEQLKEQSNKFVFDMHLMSGLWDAASQQGTTLYRAQVELMAWLEMHGMNQSDPFAGSTVRFDREMLAFWMPDLVAMLSHRQIDISSLKELCRRYSPNLYARLEAESQPRKLHRVIPDLEDTINEARFYIENFLKVGQ